MSDSAESLAIQYMREELLDERKRHAHLRLLAAERQEALETAEEKISDLLAKIENLKAGRRRSADRRIRLAVAGSIFGWTLAVIAGYMEHTGLWLIGMTDMVALSFMSIYVAATNDDGYG